MTTYRVVLDVMFEAEDLADARCKLAEVIGGYAINGDLYGVVGLNELAVMPAEADYFPPEWVASRTRRRADR